MSFNYFDGIVVAVIILSAILAYSRGFVREVMAIGGWIVAALVAYTFAPQAAPLINEVPYVDKMIQGSCQITMITAFAAVFAIALVVVSFFTPLLSGIVEKAGLGGFDHGVGFLFGALRGILLIAVLMIAHEQVLGTGGLDAVVGSRSTQVFAQLQHSILSMLPENTPVWIEERYSNLVSTCNVPTVSS